MHETVLLAAIGFFMLAVSTRRLRQDAGLRHANGIAVLRVTAVAVILAALTRCGDHRAGLAWVECLVAMSLGAVAVVLALSTRHPALLALVRLIAGAAALGRASPAVPTNRPTSALPGYARVAARTRINGDARP